MANSMTATCSKCEGDCWNDQDLNYRDFEEGAYEGAEPGRPCNAGHSAWTDALEELGLDRRDLLCASCMNEVHTTAWTIRNREDEDEEEDSTEEAAA